MFYRLNRILTTLVLIAMLVAVSASGTAAQQQSSGFSFQSLDGRMVTAESLRGRVVVLAFSATWLPLTKAQMQGVQKFADEQRGKVEVFWVSTDSAAPKSRNYASDDQLREFAKQNSLRVTVLRDPDGVMSKRLGVDQVPSIVILDRDGNVSGAPVLGFDPKGDLSQTIGTRIAKLQ